MALINHITKNLSIKIVFYGPGLSGKTTNLRYIFFKMDPVSRGEFICLETDTERTFFFDLLPLRAGRIGHYKIHFQLLTVPGQVFFEASRKSVVKSADGIVFVADSQVPLLDANLESFDSLRNNLREYDMDINTIPMVLQYNKRDLENLVPVETFNNLLNPKSCPYIESSAIFGRGVIETLKEISKLTIPAVREKLLDELEEKSDSKEGEKEKDIIQKASPQEGIEFTMSKETPELQVHKIKMKSQEAVEKKLEELAREYTDSSEE
ncbi:MAG: GTPase domain-containing protein [Candidatus Aminicenantes bacterium]|nr:GTPase domain-containing protein [Candidatus Aminicenantes bacterium]